MAEERKMAEASNTLAAAIVMAAIINVNPDKFKLSEVTHEKLANDIDNLAIQLEGKRLRRAGVI